MKTEIEEIEEVIEKYFPDFVEKEKLKILAIDIYKLGMDKAKEIFTK